MAHKDDWLAAGLTILATDGAPSLTIERLCEQLRLSKGSFYHHFKGMGGFKTALLQHFEEDTTARYIRFAEQNPSASAQVKLDHLRHLLLHAGDGSDVDVAMRAWALQDTEVREVQQRIDHTRVQYLTGLCEELSDDATDAPQLALLLYLLLIGAGHLIPPMSAEELDQLYDTALRLVPGYQRLETSQGRSTS
jgi:AcrR family transcriptional regulator